MRTCLLLVFVLLSPVEGIGQSLTQFAELPNGAPTEAARRKTAVTLNYCRAALHRIRRAGSREVLLEEQQRILNNLDLNQIDDPEVISLYRSILDEIGMVEISDRERTVITEGFRRGLQRKMGTDFFVMGAQAATGQLGSVIQTGASSWWDYRSTQLKRDSDLWQVEKNQFQSLMTRSSSFLDSFWKLSRKNEIPDRWLLRDQDLDKLGEALAVENPEVRLRSLRRLERFMECYPPYWYYVGRAQQQLGETTAAAETFRRLTEIGQGHFRQDDLLASSMANLALIEESLGDGNAAATALQAFEYSTANWEANLVCAWILSRHGRHAEAEELILCNVDEQLEVEQSTVALVSLYYHSENRRQLKTMLADAEVLRRIPIPGLLLCARMLGPDELPRSALEHLGTSLSAIPRGNGRGNSIAVAAAIAWKLNDASAVISDGSRTFEYAGHRETADGMEASFSPSLSSGPGGPPGETLRMTLRYPGTPRIELVLAEEANAAGTAERGRRRAPGLLPSLVPGIAGSGAAAGGGLRGASEKLYRIREIEVAGTRLSLSPDAPRMRELRVLKPEYSEVRDEDLRFARELR
ncbi:MAG: hypothetical protein RLZZ436_1730 [Planctomycetota bacterium]|jgi:hypothetical protein